MTDNWQSIGDVAERVLDRVAPVERITKPGIFLDFPTNAYFDDPCPTPSLTQSIAKILIDQSPAHARLEHPRLRPPATDDDEGEKYTTPKAIGNAAHSMMMGRGKEIAEGKFNNWMTKEAKTFRAEQEAAGKTVILSKHLSRAMDMVKAARAQLDAIGWHEAFTDGQGEVVIAWREGSTWFRSMIDWMSSPTRLYDYKTGAVSFAPHAIPLKMEGDGWHIQGAMQERGLDILVPDTAGRRKFRFAAQENYPPYALVGVELDEHWLTMGRKKLAYAVELWQRCMAANGWPAYPSEVLRPVYPGFKETQWLDRETAADHLMAG
jgi:PDDEXK-like domain of unknown function (DUF3799)